MAYLAQYSTGPYFIGAGLMLAVFLLANRNCLLDKAVNMMELSFMSSCMHSDSTTSSHALTEMILLRLCGRISKQVGKSSNFIQMKFIE